MIELPSHRKKQDSEATQACGIIPVYRSHKNKATLEKHKNELKENQLHEVDLSSSANDRPREKNHAFLPKSKSSNLLHARSPK
jgi:hypothetical protein